MVPDPYDPDPGPGPDTDSDDRLEHALGVAYRYLNDRDRTESEVRGQLEAKGVDPQAIELALKTLLDQGYVDDARFARLLAHDKRELEHWGSGRIRRTLLARGVDRDLIDETVGREAQTDELERALTLLRTRFPSPPGDPRERERALGVLLRKGYDSELALDALAQHARSPEINFR